MNAPRIQIETIRLALIRYHDIMRLTARADDCNAEWEEIKEALEGLEFAIDCLEEHQENAREGWPS